jgi:hypothetical protein
MVKKDQCIKEKDTYKKSMRKYLSRSTVYLFFDLGACVIQKKRRIIKCESCWKISQEEVYGTGTSKFLSLYPIFFGYSLGGYFHRERCRAPDRKKSTKERREVEVDGHVV